MRLGKNFLLPALQYLLEGGSSGFIILDHNLRIQYANPVMGTILALDAEKSQATTMQEFIHSFAPEPEAERILLSLREVLDLGTTASFQWTIPQSSPGDTSYAVDVNQLAGEENESPGLILRFLPIRVGPATDRASLIQSTAKLREDQQFAQATIDALPSHICVLDENGTIIATNRAWRNFADANGATGPQHYLGVNYLEVCDAAQGTDSEGASEFAQGIRSVMRRENDHFSLEYTCDSPWENRWFIGNVTRFKAEGPQRLVISHVNITERKRNEAELRKQKEILQTIFDDLPIMIVFIDKDGRVSMANRAWEQTLGWTVEEIQKQNLDLLSELYPDPQYRLEVLKFINSAQMKWADFKTRVRDGRMIDTSWANVKLSDGIIIGFGQDITDRKRAYDELQKRSDELARSNSLISALSQVAGQLRISLDPDQMMGILSEELTQIDTHYVITMIDPEDDSHVVRYSSLTTELQERLQTITGLRLQGLRLSNQQLSPFSELIEKWKSIFLSDPLSVAMESFPNVPEEFLEQGLELVGITRSSPVISLPLMTIDQMVGVMTIWGKDLHKEDMAVFTVFASQVTISLENARLFGQVRKGRENLHHLSRQLVDIQERERQQIARELHDEIGQILTGLKFLLEMSQQLQPEERDAGIREAKELVNNMMARIQEISLDLRPAMLDDLGLLPALLWHFNRFSTQTGVIVNFKHHGLEERRFSMEIETAAYRIVQEALTNVARYSGVKTVDVWVWADDQHLNLQVEDEGAGFNPQAVRDAHSSSGISGMYERASLCGGKLTINSSPGKGTQLFAVLPLFERLERRRDDRFDLAG